MASNRVQAGDMDRWNISNTTGKVTMLARPNGGVTIKASDDTVMLSQLEAIELMAWLSEVTA